MQRHPPQRQNHLTGYCRTRGARPPSAERASVETDAEATAGGGHANARNPQHPVRREGASDSAKSLTSLSAHDRATMVALQKLSFGASLGDLNSMNVTAVQTWLNKKGEWPCESLHHPEEERGNATQDAMASTRIVFKREDSKTGVAGMVTENMENEDTPGSAQLRVMELRADALSAENERLKNDARENKAKLEAMKGEVHRLERENQRIRAQRNKILDRVRQTVQRLNRRVQGRMLKEAAGTTVNNHPD